MPKISNQNIIQITKFVVDQGRRKLSINIDVKDAMFTLADALAQERLLKDFKSALRATLRQGITDYIEQSRGLLKSIRTSIQEQQTTAK